MSTPAFLAAFAGIQAGLVVLDLADRHLTRHSRHNGERLRAGTAVFLLAVFAAYTLLQHAGFALLPGVDELGQIVRAWFGALTGQPLGGESLDGPVLAVAAALTFYLGGLWDYLLHRFVSHSRPLWFTHEYHHLPNQIFALVPGVAARPFAVISTFPVAVATVVSVYAAFAVLGLPLGDLTPLKVILLIQVFVLTASHSSCLRRWWWVHHTLRALAITTPQEHLLHHTVDLQGNYGNFTTLWDRLFGTYLDPTRPENQGHALGLGYDQDFLGAITLGVFKLPGGWRRRFQVGRYCNIDGAGPPAATEEAA